METDKPQTPPQAPQQPKLPDPPPPRYDRPLTPAEQEMADAMGL